MKLSKYENNMLLNHTKGKDNYSGNMEFYITIKNKIIII
jgi:hypothetical protein